MKGSLIILSFFVLGLIQVFLIAALTLNEKFFLEVVYYYAYTISYLTHYKYYYRILFSLYFLLFVSVPVYWAIEIRES